MVAAALFFSVMSLLVKVGGRTLPSMQLVLARIVVTFVLGYWTVRRAGLDPWGSDRRLLALRGAFGTAALCAFYFAITRLPLGDVTAIQYTSPVLTALVAAVLLGEGIRRRDVLGFVASIVGALAIARPSVLFGTPSPLDGAGLAAATASALLSTGAYITVRVLRRSDDPLVIVFWFPLIGAPIVVPWALAVWVPPSPFEWAVMAGVGVCTHIAQVCMTRGIHLLPAGRATAIGYLQIVLAFGFGMLLFDERPDAFNVGGTLLIVLGTLVTVGAFSRGARVPAAAT